MTIKITIMIPTYNQEKYISKAVESAINQNYANLEIVISDDNSTDKTQEIIKKYLNDPRIKYFKNETNLGRVKNYHKTLYEYATGDWVLNLDGDDYLTDNKYFNKAVDLINENRNVVLVIARHLTYFEEKNKYIDNMKLRNNTIISGKDAFLSILKRDLQISHLSSLYNRKIAIENNFYTEDIIASDTASILNLILNNIDCNIGLLNDLVGVWRVSGNNASKKVNYDELTKNYIYITKIYDIARNKGNYKFIELYFAFTKALKLKLYEDIKLYVDTYNYIYIIRNIVFVNKISKIAILWCLVQVRLYLRLCINILRKLVV